MKRLIMITGSILFICIVISSYKGTYKAGAEKNAAHSTIQQEELSEECSTKASREEINGGAGYIIKAYQKRIALFREGEKEPYDISDVHISTLPLADQNRLEKGIYAADKRELEKLLEDYCS